MPEALPHKEPSRASAPDGRHLPEDRGEISAGGPESLPGECSSIHLGKQPFAARQKGSISGICHSIHFSGNMGKTSLKSSRRMAMLAMSCSMTAMVAVCGCRLSFVFRSWEEYSFFVPGRFNPRSEIKQGSKIARVGGNCSGQGSSRPEEYDQGGDRGKRLGRNMRIRARSSSCSCAIRLFPDALDRLCWNCRH